MPDLIIKLQDAVKQENLEQVQKLLAFVELENTTSNNESCTKLNSVKIQHQFDLFSIAVEKKNRDIMKLFIKKGFELNYENLKWTEVPLLQKAVETGDVKIVQLLLIAGANIDGPKTGYSPLHCAAKNNEEDIVQLLLDAFADFDKFDESNRTPLHLAAEKGHLSIVKMLVDHGAATDVADLDNCFPVDYAAKMGHADVFSFLLNKIDDSETLTESIANIMFHAALGGKIEIIEILLNNRKIDVDMYCTPFKETALHIAVTYKKEKLIKFLLEQRANVNVVDWAGSTPLNIAVSMKHKESAELLLLNGARVNEKDVRDLQSLQLL